MDDLFFSFLPVLIIALVLFSVGWIYWRSSQLVERWAKENGHKLLQKEIRFLRTGPYFLRRSRNQVVYRVAIRDNTGRRRDGWVRVGSWWWGLMSDDVDVTWEDER